jgi:hypothetical protein
MAEYTNIPGYGNAPLPPEYQQAFPMHPVGIQGHPAVPQAVPSHLPPELAAQYSMPQAKPAPPGMFSNNLNQSHSSKMDQNVSTFCRHLIVKHFSFDHI